MVKKKKAVGYMHTQQDKASDMVLELGDSR